MFNILFTVLSLVDTSLGQSGCQVFFEGSCPITEYTTCNDGFSHTNTAAECQDKCRAREDCVIFTWFNRQCYLLISCDDVYSCPGCISGPGTGSEPDVDTCDVQSPTTTPGPTTPTITTTTSATTTAASTTTTTSLSTSCDDFFLDENMVCSTVEDNVLEHIENIAEAFHCQKMCQVYKDCTYWAFYANTCDLLKTCDVFETCSSFKEESGPCDNGCECYSGPEWPEFSECVGI